MCLWNNKVPHSCMDSQDSLVHTVCQSSMSDISEIVHQSTVPVFHLVTVHWEGQKGK
jgi:hypothetical protein